MEEKKKLKIMGGFPGEQGKDRQLSLARASIRSAR